ncbi:ABC transporter permease subunit [Youngiibacter fragilis]|uniref:ABC transporter n=1 Tax=Youngiibacter fragilis 232.1 TaxID=994573 RepID=V7I255_9CLOT|nr:ABC transporter permease subunit [Youngiibacter fragilis]ETA79366.1 ABC transporter [Youngiibacter fragilis 232.1]
MNIYFKEMKAQVRSLIFWGIGILAMTFGGMSKYGALEVTGQDINAIMDAMPKFLKLLFGMNGLDIGTLAGYFGVLIAYLILMAAIHAAMLGANIVSKEENVKTSEFLMVKPRSRTQIMAAKILAGFTGLIIFNAMMFAMSKFSVDFYSKGENIDSLLYEMTISMLLIQCIFFLIRTSVASVVKRPKVSTSLVMSITLVFYLTSVLSEMVEQGKFLRYLTPFRFFSVPELIDGTGLRPEFIMISAAAILILNVVTFRGFNKRDLYI